MTSQLDIRLENESDVDTWKLDRIEDALEQVAGKLVDRWLIDVENNLSDNLVDVRLVNDFDARIENGTVHISDPDLYRRGMLNRFDGEDQEEVRERVNRFYPVQYHEIPEEIGQLLGRKFRNGWKDYELPGAGIKDELHGIMALECLCPGFLPHYRKEIEQNLETIEMLNSREQVRELSRADNIREIDYHTDEERFEYTRSRKEMPSTLLEAVEDITEDSVEYNLEEMGVEELENWRRTKMRADMKPWFGYLTAIKAFEQLKEDYTEREILEMKPYEEIGDTFSAEYESLEDSYIPEAKV